LTDVTATKVTNDGTQAHHTAVRRTSPTELGKNKLPCTLRTHVKLCKGITDDSTDF